MLRNVFAKSLHDRRRGLVGWSTGVVAMTAFLLAFYPAVRSRAADLDRMVANYPDALKALSGLGNGGTYATPGGYLRSELFATMAPLLLLVFAIGAGASAIAGEEDKGTLDLLLAHAVPRRRVVLEKFAATAACIALLGGLVLAAAAGMAAVIGMRLGGTGIVTAVALVVLLAVLFDALALALGCLTGKRGLSIGVASAVAVGAFLLHALAPLARPLAPWRRLSPFYWYLGDKPWAGGFPWARGLALALSAAILALVAVQAFERRDLVGS